MPGAAIGTSLNYGFAGSVAREGKAQPEIGSYPVKSDSNPIKFGTPVVLNTDGTVSAATSATLSATNFLGVAVAEVKTNTTFPNPVGTAQETGSYLASHMASVLKLGTIAVKTFATPTAGGAVNVRITANGSFPAEVVGDFCAADGGNTVALTNAKYATNRKDANGITELAIQSPTV